MRISDCSSDVCSSDLGVGANFASAVMEKAPEWADLSKGARSKKTVNIPLYVDLLGRILRTAMHDMGFGFETRNFGRAVRSEEHTSELQSLMRISYAVFCLKKKQHKQH